jgi:hypothetical protein
MLFYTRTKILLWLKRKEKRPDVTLNEAKNSCMHSFLYKHTNAYNTQT